MNALKYCVPSDFQDFVEILKIFRLSIDSVKQGSRISVPHSSYLLKMFVSYQREWTEYKDWIGWQVILQHVHQHHHYAQYVQ